ncbi:MAG: hypothetical protein LBS82_03495 [Spirochaetaceae bacterium]|jgi:hypothetical protein|nr:hypothetical protein [Spirochaetaceae bacterium]
MVKEKSVGIKSKEYRMSKAMSERAVGHVKKDAPVQAGILLNKPVEAGMPCQAQPSLKLRVNRLYGAFKETPIPDKSDLRRQFHEDGAR